MKNTVSFITKNFNRYDVSSLTAYEAIGGMKALKKALVMDGEDIAALLTEAQIKGRGGAAYPMEKNGLRLKW